MSIYLVAIYGNEKEGANGADTLFLVRAPSYTEAADIVDADVSGRRTVNWVCLVGSDCTEIGTASIVNGPLLGLASFKDYNQIWTREAGCHEWQPISSYGRGKN